MGLHGATTQKPTTDMYSTHLLQYESTCSLYSGKYSKLQLTNTKLQPTVETTTTVFFLSILT